MSSKAKLLQSIQNATNGLSLSAWLLDHPDTARRSAQRWAAQLVSDGLVTAKGDARARRYFFLSINTKNTKQSIGENEESYEGHIPLSADSKDILAYINQPLEARQPVGYQRDFLEGYEPNKTFYLSSSLRGQLHKMGNTQSAELPAGTYGRSILNRLLIDLSWASSHLEGNTYSRLDTHDLIENGNSAQGKAAIETQMILNHKSAIELLVDNIDSMNFDRFTLLNLHSALSENLLPNPADEGRVREHIVEICKSVYRPLAVSSQINEMFDLILAKVNRIKDPFEQSFFVMVYLPYLQPFADINKRSSRLAANLPLIRHNLCPLTFLDVPVREYTHAILGVYELTRIELLRDLFVWAYERSTKEYLVIKQGLTEPDPIRLAYRDLIKKTLYKVITDYEKDPLDIINVEVEQQVVNSDERSNVNALIIEELRRLHEGVLARYGLRPSEFETWKQKQRSRY